MKVTRVHKLGLPAMMSVFTLANEWDAMLRSVGCTIRDHVGYHPLGWEVRYGTATGGLHRGASFIIPIIVTAGSTIPDEVSDAEWKPIADGLNSIMRVFDDYLDGNIAWR